MTGTPLPYIQLLVALIFTAMQVLGLAISQAEEKMEKVQGVGCYRFGDDETPGKARRAAIAMAQEQAVRAHRVFIESASRVKNFQLEEDIIDTASAAILKDVIVEKEERKSQEICVTIKANLSPLSAEDMIRQRVQAKEISQEAQTVLIPTQATFGVKVWTNKDTNRFVEDDRLVIFVRSERDAYLKLDYFQADGTVVHLVPNVYRGQAQIIGGKTYSFGDESGPDQYLINGPYGDETIKAIVSAQPFTSPNEPTEAVSESRSYLRGLKANPRGVQLVAATASVSLKTESKTVKEFKRVTQKPDDADESKN